MGDVIVIVVTLFAPCGRLYRFRETVYRLRGHRCCGDRERGGVVARHGWRPSGALWSPPAGWLYSAAADTGRRSSWAMRASSELTKARSAVTSALSVGATEAEAAAAVAACNWARLTASFG
jgi:hypothetical protein